VDHALRRERLAARIAELGLDALLVTHLPNVRYLTGFAGSSAELVVGRDGAMLLIDGRYVQQATRQAPDVERRPCLDGYTGPSLDAAAAFGDRVGFERRRIGYAEWEGLRERGHALALVPTDGVVEDLRVAKDGDERELIVAAQRAAETAFDEVVLGGGLREGVEERDVALALEVTMRRAGADGLGFAPIVGFGEHSAEPHHEPGRRPLRTGDLIVLDFGARVGGYRSDMTRTVSLGDPGPRLREVHALVARAQAAGVAAVGPDALAGDVDAAARAIIADAGLADAFSHPVGHGVGLEIHESPIMRATCTDRLRPGAVVTVEPGVYIPGVGGVRIEDMVEVTPDGSRIIPRTAKELIVL